MKRRFSSYGPINIKTEYYAPRSALIESVTRQLLGASEADEGGHYITIWAPRQTGKTWTMLETVKAIRASNNEANACFMSMESAKSETSAQVILEIFSREMRRALNDSVPTISEWKDFPALFSHECLDKPLILIIDKFDAIGEEFIGKFASEFRNLYLSRKNEASLSHEKTYLLHGLALIGVRSVLGIENATGSPFNVQRSVRIPNLTFEEVAGMFDWYQRDSGQRIEPEVVARLFAETNGQPGLVGWLGELLTETYNCTPDAPITMREFEGMYAAAVNLLPNNTILNMLSKAKQPPYRDFALRLFDTEKKMSFAYDSPEMNYLYVNGVIDYDTVDQIQQYARFSCPFVQKRLFNYFAKEVFHDIGRMLDPFDDLSDIFTGDALCLPPLLARYQAYLRQNSRWLFQNAPRRADLRIYEAVYHFNLYLYLHQFLRGKGAEVWPEFPTGNVKIDILIAYRGHMYGLELKTFADVAEYRNALAQAAQYGKQLRLAEITLLFFIESISAKHRETYERPLLDEQTGVTVTPVFIETGV
ncbi:hypothetical protein U14_03882 [Candidatus Moduliflexus flocculans]|uniref:Uncharacterized protein n=1 Tax=Candidatus Moduliflexus flocculans TaxID=1499966 RepID=A0A081BQG4_9BACT|nr:hypothetical protein U14_03882 [Candidatus Moduliflexus flocculans]